MSRDFKRRVREAISNPNLQEALERNARRRMNAWRQSFASQTGVEEHRKRANQIRKHVVENLENYLERFTQNIENNGFQVHKAEDSEEACRLILNIAQKHHARLVAKSKSMLSEEIGLNRALEREGIRVVETDLGEFIVQLRGEPPSHIITPAVHLRREDVAETFERALGMPYSTDVEDMNAAARTALREVFLSAQVGISGVNFGVAENGTLCIVTNEGNGRMVTTIPSVHIAIMGVERIVPTLDDLALMLQLLPRAATGQKITSYVSLIRTPRSREDPDGPEERHLVMVNNGRLEMAGTWQAESLLCIRCGACLNACPVFREIGGHAYDSPYPGPIGSVISPGLFGMEAYGHLAMASTLCGACRDVCPVLIDLPVQLARTRQAYNQEVPAPISLRLMMNLYAWIMKSPGRYRWAQRFTAWTGQLLPRENGWLKKLPLRLSSWTKSRHFPPFASKPFRTRIGTRTSDDQQKSPSDVKLDETLLAVEEPIQEDLVIRFRKELEALGGVFIRCGEKEAPHRVVDQLRNLNVDSLIAWNERGSAIISEVLRYLIQEGFEIRDPTLPYGEGEQRQERLTDLRGIDAGLTGAVAGFAETGTLVVPAGQNRSQLASLIPPVHLVLFSTDQLYRTMPDWLEAGGSKTIMDAQYTTLISGPSRTADIEMTLTIGVHGPGKLIVICID